MKELKPFNLDLWISTYDLERLKKCLISKKFNVDNLTEDDLLIIYRRWLLGYMELQEDVWEEMLEDDLHDDDYLQEMLGAKGFYNY